MIRKDYLSPQNGFDMNYIIYTPETESLEELPLLVYLHGAGERGLKIDHLPRYAFPRIIESGREYNAVILCPQCPCEFVWDNVAAKLKAIIDKVAAEYKIKPDRIAITGSSMGGFGSWCMGQIYGNFFSGVGPVAGGGMSWRCKNLINTPVYALHGDRDIDVPLIYSRLMVDAVNAFGGNAKLRILEGFGHGDGIDEAYENTDLVEWLISQRRSDFTPVPEAFSEQF